MSIIEGELQMNEKGHLLISGNLIHPGTIVEVEIQNAWISICIEESHGIYYPIPHFDLRAGLRARMEGCPTCATFCPTGRI
jgi:hypothetical protein